MKHIDIFALNKARIKRFEKIEGKSWGVEGAMIELAKQVGDLSSLVMTKEGYYFQGRKKYNSKYSKDTSKIADELADIVFAVTRIAKHYNIDVLDATKKASKDDEEWFRENDIKF